MQTNICVLQGFLFVFMKFFRLRSIEKMSEKQKIKKSLSLFDAMKREEIFLQMDLGDNSFFIISIDKSRARLYNKYRMTQCAIYPKEGKNYAFFAF